jgi:hypothetical protein
VNLAASVFLVVVSRTKVHVAKTADWTRGMMESLYIELRQTYPGNKLHLMLVSPFIVETGTGFQYNVLKKRRLYTVQCTVYIVTFRVL